MNLSIPYTEKWYIDKIQSYVKDLNRSGKKFNTIRNDMCDLLSFKPLYEFPKNKILVYKNNNKKTFDDKTIGQWTIVVKYRKSKEIRANKYYLNDNTSRSSIKIRIYE